MSLAKTIPLPHKQYGMYYVEEDLRDAAYRGDLKHIQKLMLQYPKLNLNAINEYHETALYVACKTNHDKQYQVADYLLKQPNIDVNKSTILGNSALLISAWKDKTGLAIKLIEHGADIQARTNADRQYHGGVSTLDIAQERGNTELANYLKQLLNNQNNPKQRI